MNGGMPTLRSGLALFSSGPGCRFYVARLHIAQSYMTCTPYTAPQHSTPGEPNATGCQVERGWGMHPANQCYLQVSPLEVHRSFSETSFGSILYVLPHYHRAGSRPELSDDAESRQGLPGAPGGPREPPGGAGGRRGPPGAARAPPGGPGAPGAAGSRRGGEGRRDPPGASKGVPGAAGSRPGDRPGAAREPPRVPGAAREPPGAAREPPGALRDDFGVGVFA